MPKYPLAIRAEAIALAAIVGVEPAAEAMGIDKRSVRTWTEQAGRAPELVAKPDEWKRLHDLAIAKVTSDLASGKMRPRDVAVVAAIAKRNLTKPDPMVAKQTDVEAWSDELSARLDKTYDPDDVPIAFAAVVEWLESRDPDTEGPSVDDVLSHVQSLGDLDEWWERRHIETTLRYQAQLAKNEAVAAAHKAEYEARMAPQLPVPVPDAIVDRLDGLPVDDLREGRADGGASKRSPWPRDVWVVEL